MSGPKVVRIVTPEQRRIIRQRWLSRLKNKIGQLKDYAANHDMLTDELEKALEEMWEHYQHISEDDYARIRREVPEQIRYLEGEKKNLVKKVVKERSSKWEIFKNLNSTHNELRFLLEKKNVVFNDFKAPTTINEVEIEAYRKKVDTLYAMLRDTSINSKELTGEQEAIQQRLSKGDSLLSVEEWRSDKPQVISRLKKLENTLKEMFVSEVAGGKIQKFMDRCAQLDRNAPNYNLLLDSLTIEAAEFSKNQSALREAKEELKLAIYELETLEVEIGFIEHWKALLNTENLVEINDTLKKANRLYEEVSERIITETRRDAIKKALQEAGYEVNDTMETAWVENGRLVVKKASNSLYGVEFMSPKNFSRIQARVVADENRNNERSPDLDKNQEEIWCDEFDDIREILESQNLSIEIDKFEEPGAVKLKEVKLNESHVQGALKQKRNRKY